VRLRLRHHRPGPRPPPARQPQLTHQAQRHQCRPPPRRLLLRPAVQITRVFHRVRHAEARPAGGPSGVLTTSDAPIATAGLLNAPADSTVGRVVSAAARLIDRYGLAFLVSQRMVVGLASVFTIYGGLRAGVDVQGWLAAHDLASAGGMAVGNVAGTWAAAACCAAALFPGVVLGAGALAPRLAALRRALWKSGR
jgi:hypothetical protein